MSEKNVPVFQPAGTGIMAANSNAVDMMVGQKNDILKLLKTVMIPGIDFGIIPGTGKNAKPSLLKSGAEKILMFFSLRPHTEIERVIEQQTGHMTIFSKTDIHASDGTYLGDGSAVCSTRETKYAFKRANVVCPKCKAEAIRKGKAEYGGGWFCSSNNGGCGAKFDEKNEEIINQNGQTATNPADFYNTVVKMAQKRSVVAAVLLTTAASSVFTQDMGEGDLNAAPELQGILSPDEAEAIAKEAVDSGVDITEMLRYFGLVDIYGLRHDNVPKIRDEMKRLKVKRGG